MHCQGEIIGTSLIFQKQVKDYYGKRHVDLPCSTIFMKVEGAVMWWKGARNSVTGSIKLFFLLGKNNKNMTVMIMIMTEMNKYYPYLI